MKQNSIKFVIKQFGIKKEGGGICLTQEKNKIKANFITYYNLKQINEIYILYYLYTVNVHEYK